MKFGLTTTENGLKNKSRQHKCQRLLKYIAEKSAKLFNLHIIEFNRG